MTTRTASRATSAQVVTVLSLGPKQPHETVMPRTTAEAIAPSKSASSSAAVQAEARVNRPTTR